MPNNPIPIAIAVLLLTQSDAHRPLGSITRSPLGSIMGRTNAPLRIAPSSIPELEDTLSGMLNALHTLDKLKNLGTMAQSLSGMGSLLQSLPQSIPTPMQTDNFSNEAAYNNPSAAVPSAVPAVTPSLPDISKLMEIAGPVISAINSPR